MEKENNSTYRDNDLARNPTSFLRLWGPPIALILLAPLGTSQGWWSGTTEIILWSVAVAWIGVNCYINGRKCGRLHCKIIGIAFPLLGVVGILIALDIITLSFNTLNIAFWIILIGSFIPEFFGKKYLIQK